MQGDGNLMCLGALIGMETASRLSVSTSYGDLHSQSDDVSALKAELARCRRYTETLHAAIYGGLEAFAYQMPRDNMYTDSSGDGRSSHQGRTNAIDAKINTLQDWQRCLEAAPDQELVCCSTVPKKSISIHS